MWSIHLIFTFFPQKEARHCFLPAHCSFDFCRSAEEKAARNPTLPRKIHDEFSSPILTSDCKVRSRKETTDAITAEFD